MAFHASKIFSLFGVSNVYVLFDVSVDNYNNLDKNYLFLKDKYKNSQTHLDFIDESYEILSLFKEFPDLVYLLE